MSRIRTLVGALVAVFLIALGSAPALGQAAPAPTVTGTDPAFRGNFGDGVISVIGTGFQVGAQVRITKQGTFPETIAPIEGSGESVTSATRIDNVRLALLGASPGFWNVTVTNPDGQSASFGSAGNPPVTQPTGFEVRANGPSLTSVSPSAAPRNSNQTLTLTGSQFAKGATIKFTDKAQTPPDSSDDIVVTAQTWNSPTQYTVQVRIPDDAQVAVNNVTLENTDKKVTPACQCFTPTNDVVANPPTISTVKDAGTNTDASGFNNGTTNTDVSGTNFPVDKANMRITLERAGQTPIPMTIGTVTQGGSFPPSDDKATGTFDLTFAAPGKWDVRVTDTTPGTGGGSASKANAFTVVSDGVPNVTKVTPNVSNQGQAVEVTIEGTHFARGDAVSLTNGSGITVRNVEVKSPTQITATFDVGPNAAGGAHSVVVTHPGPPAESSDFNGPKFTVNASGFNYTAYPGFRGGAFLAGGNLNAVPGGDAIVTGAGAGGGPHVVVWQVDPAGTAKAVASFFAFGSGFAGGVRVAIGNVNVDSPGNEVITAAGPGGGPHVKVWRINNDGTATELGGFFAYGGSFGGGVNVAAGNLDQANATDEILTGAGPGGGPHIKIFDGPTLTEKRGTFAYGPTFAGGVSVAAGDVDTSVTGDEIVVGAGPGGGPHVKEMNANSLADIRGQFVFGSSFVGGVNVGAGNVDTSAGDELIVAAGPTGGPHVRALAGLTFSEVAGFFAYTSDYSGGVMPAVADFDGNPPGEIITTPQTGTPIVVGKRVI